MRTYTVVLNEADKALIQNALIWFKDVIDPDKNLDKLIYRFQTLKGHSHEQQKS